MKKSNRKRKYTKRATVSITLDTFIDLGRLKAMSGHSKAQIIRDAIMYYRGAIDRGDVTL